MPQQLLDPGPLVTSYRRIADAAEARARMHRAAGEHQQAKIADLLASTYRDVIGDLEAGELVSPPMMLFTVHHEPDGYAPNMGYVVKASTTRDHEHYRGPQWAATYRAGVWNKGEAALGSPQLPDLAGLN